MARRQAQLNETIQQLGDVSIADAFGLGNVQLVEPGLQRLDSNADLILMTLSASATVALPEVRDAVLSYVYTARNIGSGTLTIVTSAVELLDRATSSVQVPPAATVTFAAIEEEDGNREWIVVSKTGTGGAGAVDSVHGRSGAVVSADGDYTFAELGGDVEDSDTADNDTSKVLSPNGAGGVDWRAESVTSVHGRTGAVTAVDSDYTFSLIGGDIDGSITTDTDTTKVLSPDGAGKVEWRAEATAPVASVHGRTGAVVAVDGDYTFALLGGDIDDSDTVDTDTTKVLSPDGAGKVAWRAEASAPVASVFGRTGAVVAVDGDYTFGQLGGDIDDSDTVDTDTTKVLSPDGAGKVAWRAEASTAVSSVHGRTGAVVAVDGDYTFAQLGGDVENSDTANTTTTNVLAPNGSGGVEWRAESIGGAKAFAYARENTENETVTYGPTRERFDRTSTLHASSGFSGGTSGCRVTYTNAATVNFLATASGTHKRGGGGNEPFTWQISVNNTTVIRERGHQGTTDRESISMSGILTGITQNDTIEIYLDDVDGSITSSDWSLTLIQI